MTIHSDYWWYVQTALQYADAAVCLAKQAEADIREALFVPYVHEVAAKYMRMLEERMEKLSVTDRVIIRKLIKEMMI